MNWLLLQQLGSAFSLKLIDENIDERRKDSTRVFYEIFHEPRSANMPS